MIQSPATAARLPLTRDETPGEARETPVCDREGCENRIPWERWIRSGRRARTCSDTCTQIKARLRNPRLSEASEAQLRLALGERQSELPAEPEKKKATIQERFDRWVEEHPGVYRLIRKYAYEYLEAWLQWEDGRRRKVGIDLIVGRVRYEHNIEKKGAEPWAINNDFRSRIPRRLAQEDARFADLFEMRELKAP